MCKYFDDCNYCMYDKQKCECMGDGSPICHYFICCYCEDCNKDCISDDELREIYNG